MQSSLTQDKILNSLVYRRLLYVNIYDSYELSEVTTLWRYRNVCIIIIIIISTNSPVF